MIALMNAKNAKFHCNNRYCYCNLKKTTLKEQAKLFLHPEFFIQTKITFY